LAVQKVKINNRQAVWYILKGKIVNAIGGCLDFLLWTLSFYEWTKRKGQ